MTQQSDKPMYNKVCIVTGAACGIGAATAHALAQQGATLVLVDRDTERGTTTLNRIKRQTGNASVELVLTDLSAQQEVRQLAQYFKDHYSRLDVLINNAGAMFNTRRETVDGIEMTFGLNYLSQFLLTNLLLDVLKASAPARIINVSSRSHVRVPGINFDDLESRVNYQDLLTYAHSKLAVMVFTYELARRLEGTGVTANTLHPGIVATNFTRHGRGKIGLVMRLCSPFFLSARRGAETSVYLATSPEVAGVTGKYFVKCEPAPTSPGSYDRDAARRLWEISETYTNLRMTDQKQPMG